MEEVGSEKDEVGSRNVRVGSNVGGGGAKSGKT
jgi:hypothetical protein